MKMNKKTCMHCINHRWDETWYWSSKADEKLWRKGFVNCPASTDNVNIDDPDNEEVECKCRMEHAIMNQKDLE